MTQACVQCTVNSEHPQWQLGLCLSDIGETTNFQKTWLTISSGETFLGINHQNGVILINAIMQGLRCPVICTHQGSKSCSILPSRMGEHGVSWENMGNMENMENMGNMGNMEKMEKINQMT